MKLTQATFCCFIWLYKELGQQTHLLLKLVRQSHQFDLNKIAPSYSQNTVILNFSSPSVDFGKEKKMGMAELAAAEMVMVVMMRVLVGGEKREVRVERGER